MAADFFKTIQQFIKTADRNTIAKGKTLFAEIKDDDKYNLSYSSGNSILFTTLFESSDGFDVYEVEITCDLKSDEVDGVCTCPYFDENFIPCKHLVAATLQMEHVVKEEKLFAAEITNKPSVVKTPKQVGPFRFFLPKIDYTSINNVTSAKTLTKIRSFLYLLPSHIQMSNEGKTWAASFTDGHKSSIQWHEGSIFEIDCTCNTLSNSELCVHPAAIFLYISNHYSFVYFKQFEDNSTAKAALLKQYGIAPDHPLATEFTFAFDYSGNLSIKEVPKQLLNPLAYGFNWNKMKEKIQPKKTIIINIDEKKSLSKEYQTGILFNFNRVDLGGFEPQLLMVTEKKKGTGRTFEKMTLKENAHLAFLTGIPNEMKEILKRLILENTIKYLQQNGQLHSFSPSASLQYLSSESQSLLQKYYYRLLEEIKPFMSSFKLLFYLPENQKFNAANIQQASFSVLEPQLCFALQEDDHFVSLHASVNINNSIYQLSHFKRMQFFLFDKNEFFLIAEKDVKTIELFQKGYITTAKSNQAEFIQNIAIPLSNRYPVDFGKMLNQVEIEPDTMPKPAAYFSELNENFLLVQIKWFYDSYCVEDWDEDTTVIETGNGIVKVKRNTEAEKKNIEEVRALHRRFEFQDKGFFYVNFQEAMHNNWFITANQQLSDMGFAVYGLKELKKLKYNTHTPTITIETSSDIDWFDLKIEVRYGDIVVPLADLRKAFKNNQDYILLSDGTMGMLPKEWIQKYAGLLKLGQIKDGTLKVSKFNWTLLDSLHEQIDNTAVLQELEDKKQRLKNIDTSTTYKLSKNIKAKLRDYQVAGFQWLCLLDDLGWGGCLADDMGLGKTLQTICFLQYRLDLDKDSNKPHLIVCPTSLIYNWEAELQKFAPKIKYHIHYGTARNFDADEMRGHQVVITSYGLMRTDIEKFRDLRFDYVVLDESQAIKNPASQSAKAVQLLQADNRLALSGTPIQNNTLDLYAQMNFLNPGMLQSLEFFKEEFATPIDKVGDKEKSAQLRKLIYPFMLRRTKEQVAKDLPDKTESILWCEMEAEQRKIYNSFKEYYRESLLGRITTDGMGKSSIYILEGLTKLRQICNSPAILNEKEKFPNESIKLAELTREIEENTGSHKALVFSQFTTMLALIEEQLKKDGIEYMYLDGSTPAAARKAAVEKFQSDETVRVFLISLKAGGVGLNLTSADYVYIVDPWWNPAAESQAIDRTHRIGQTQKVFAYKMICKDTVEEKILQLQQRKKALAADLIADEASFVKKLTKEDVAFLFE